MLLKRYIWISSLVVCFYFGGKLIGKPDIDVSRHLQKTDMELWDGHEYSFSELQHVAN